MLSIDQRPHPVNQGLYVVMGVAGAGKSLIGAELARALGVEFVEGDDYHPPSNVAKMAAGTPLTDEDRADWLDALGTRLRIAHESQQGIVVACSALKRSYRDRLRRGAGAPVQFILLHGSRDVIAQRLARRRGHFMPASLLDSQFATLEIPTPDEGAWTEDVDQPAEAIVAALVARAKETR